MAADFKSLSPVDLGALGAGAVAILFSFFTAYITVSVKGGENLGVDVSGSNGVSAWNSWATIGMLLILIAVAVVALKAFAADLLPAGAPWRLIALATAALGTVLIILRALTAGNGNVSGSSFGAVSVSVGPGWSGWVLFIATIALTVFTALAFKDSGEKLPEVNKKSDPSA